MKLLKGAPSVGTALRGQLFLALLHAGRSRVVLISAGAWKAELNGPGCAFEQKHERDQYEEREGYKSKRFDEAEQRRLSRNLHPQHLHRIRVGNASSGCVEPSAEARDCKD